MLTLLFTLSALIFLIFPESVSGWVDTSLIAVKNVVLATLFPMMVITRMIDPPQFLKKASLWRSLSLSDLLLSPVLRGIISGFPSAALEVEELLRKGKISKEEGEKALALASAPSPAFVIAVAGKSFPSGLFAFLLSLAVTYLTVKGRVSKKSVGEGSPLPLSFPRALSGAVTASLTVSASILFFNFLLSLFSFLPPSLLLLLNAVTELGSGALALRSHPLLLSFLVGWGGLSALAQVSASAPSLSLRLYIKARLLSGAVLALSSFFLF